MTDWVAWHEGYDDPTSAISLRLQEVQEQVTAYLDAAPSIRQWWADAGWTELAFLSPGPETASVAVFRLDTDPLPFQDMRLFTFV